MHCNDRGWQLVKETHGSGPPLFQYDILKLAHVTVGGINSSYFIVLGLFSIVEVSTSDLNSKGLFGWILRN